jgi:uncharacterized protein involved in response to NO
VSLSKHPVWLVGFRPFFILSCLSGLSLPIIWALMFAGAIGLPYGIFHRAVACPRDVLRLRLGHARRLPAHRHQELGEDPRLPRQRAGLPRCRLVLRAARHGFGAAWPQPLFLLSNQLFLVAIVAMLLWTLLRHRETDGYRRDNMFFLLLLPLFPLAKFLLLDGLTGPGRPD